MDIRWKSEENSDRRVSVRFRDDSFYKINRIGSDSKLSRDPFQADQYFQIERDRWKRLKRPALSEVLMTSSERFNAHKLAICT